MRKEVRLGRCEPHVQEQSSFGPRMVRRLIEHNEAGTPHVSLMFMLLGLTSWFLYPSTTMNTVRPPKRRRTGHRLPPMVEGSDATVDTALYIHSEGGEPLLVPVRPENSDSATGHSEHEIDSAFAPLPEPHLHYDQQPTDIHINCEQEHTTRRDRSFYMKE
jgi:hypothetical protein